jgi:hypothetical protein
MTETAVRHHFDVDVDRMYALVTDPDFLRRRAEAAGEQNVDVAVDRTGEPVTVQITREVEQGLPSFMKKLFSPRNRLIDRQSWRREGGARVSDWTVQVGDGKRIQLRGRLTLAPGAAGGCDYTESFSAEANIPLVGGRVAKYVLGETEATIRRQVEFTVKELAAK